MGLEHHRQSWTWRCSQGVWESGQLEKLGPLNREVQQHCSHIPLLQLSITCATPCHRIKPAARNVYKRKQYPKLFGLGAAVLHGRHQEGTLLHFSVDLQGLA